MEAVLTITDIMDAIGQRYPYLMVDRIIELQPREKIVGLKNITMNEPFFPGHFPGAPIVPGTIVVESMAQVATFLFYESEKPKQHLNFFLGAIKDARFYHPVVPGDQLTIEATPIRLAEDTAYIKTCASVEKKKVSEAELIFVRRKTP